MVDMSTGRDGIVDGVDVAKSMFRVTGIFIGVTITVGIVIGESVLIGVTVTVRWLSSYTIVLPKISGLVVVSSSVQLQLVVLGMSVVVGL